jgi:hypothetical protein
MQFMQTRAKVNLVKNCYAFTRGNNVSDCFSKSMLRV